MFEHVSHEAKDFIFKMLQPNPEQRMSANEALKHEWMTATKEDVFLDVEVINRLKSFVPKKKLQ